MISIVIPTHNGMRTLPAVFDAIAAQRIDDELEVVIIDTASTDGTATLVRERATRVIAIDAPAFNHGTSRNRAVAVSRGELVVLLSQDAEPADDHWLQHLTSPLRRQDDVAGTFARQVPRMNATAITRHYNETWPGSATTPRRSQVGRSVYERLSPLDKMHACMFDNVCSCMRRDVWERFPFAATPIAEDLEWARNVLLAGYAIEFVPDAVVHHSHDRSATYEYLRTALLHQRLHELFGARTIPTLPALLRAVSSTLRVHWQCRRDAPPSVPVDSMGRAIALAVAWPLGQYVGGRRAVRGLPPLRTSRV